MGSLDTLFKKRLERIREELNTYIDVHIPQEDKFLSEPIAGRVSGEKKTRLLDSFLNCMKISDESYNDDDSYYDDDEMFVEGQMDECTSRPCGTMQAPKPMPTSYGSSDSFNLPEYLRRKEEKHLDLDNILEHKEESFSEMLLRLIDEKGLKDSDVYKRANIDRRLFSKIRGDENYVPSKKTAISFCLALQLDLDESKNLLETAGYALSSSSRFDLIIMYLIETKEYNIHFVNIVLDDYGEGTLSR